MGRKETTNKEVIHTQIIKCACELFLQEGIKDIKMDDIAKHLGISKRTIYEQFTDKEELLYECLYLLQKYLREKLLPYLKNHEINSLEKLMICYSIYFRILKHTSRKFLMDLDKYPEVKEERKKKQKQNEKIFMLWIKQCIDEGLLRKDIDISLIKYIIQRDMELLATSTEFPEYTTEELGRTFILFYMRGIATDKGAVIIEEYIQNNKYLDL